MGFAYEELALSFINLLAFKGILSSTLKLNALAIKLFVSHKISGYEKLV
jgi:hypothetical protein